MVAFWGFFLFVLPPRLVAGTDAIAPRMALTVPLWLSATLFGLASLLGLWSAWTMAARGRGTPLPVDTARELVVSGPYRYLRNPMAVAGVLQGVAVSFYHASWVPLAFFLVGGLLWHGLVRPIEERDLAERFGAPYAAYREATGLWWPRRQ